MGVGRTAFRGAMSLCMLAFVWLAWPSHGHAQTSTDWQRGLLIASAAAPADLRAPNADLARVKAERVARKRCHQRLREAAGKLPLASGRKVSSALEQPLPEEGLGLIALATDQGSDGSVVVRMALPIDALRTRLYGADTPTKALPAASASILVDARSLKLRPSIGLVLKATGAEYRGPVLFFKDEALARAHQQVGKDAALIPATRSKAGTLEVDDAALKDRFAEMPLVVVLYSEGK